MYTFQAQIVKEIEKIKNIMKILDFSDEQIEKQVKELGEVLVMTIWIKLIEGKDSSAIQGEPNEDDIKNFVKDNYSPEEAEKIIETESEKIITGYFTEIMKDAPQEKLEQIKTILEEK